MKLIKLISILLSLSLLISLAGCAENMVTGDGNMKITKDPTERTVFAKEKNVKLIGRTHLDKDNVRWLVQSASGIEFIAEGTDLVINFVGDNAAKAGNFNSSARFAIYVNGERVTDMIMDEAEKAIPVALSEGENIVKVVKLSEVMDSIVGIKSISLTSTADPRPTEASSLKIEFIGDSITCGYGVDIEDRDQHFSTTTEDATKSYACKTAEILGADYSLVSYSGHGIISAYTGDGKINESGLVPPIYTQLGKMWDQSNPIKVQEVEWDFKSFKPDIVVLNLGTNDQSYVGKDPDKMRAFSDGYKAFLKVVRENNPDAHIVCTLGLMGGETYVGVETAVNEYKAEENDENISCFLLGNIRPEEGYAADWHPTNATHTRASKELTLHLISVSEKAKTCYETQVAAGKTEKID